MSYRTTSCLSLVAAIALGVSLNASEPARASAGADGYAMVPAAEQGAVDVVKTRPLYRFRKRPWLRKPVGAAILAKAPQGVSLADFHRQVTSGQVLAAVSPSQLAGATVEVTRRGEHYEVRVTAQERSVALEIQRRAAELTASLR